MDEHVITDATQLAATYEPPIDRALRKQIDRLDEHCRALIADQPAARA